MRYTSFIVLVFCLSACKVNKTKPTTEPDTTLDSLSLPEVTIEKDSVYLITQAGDTLTSLTEEVDIEAYRLLPDTVTLMAVGDIMTGTNFPNTSYLPSDTGRYLWEEVKTILPHADITFGNLEGTILNDGGDQKKCKNPAVCYLFRSPEYLAVNLMESGFDLLSLANNHANDFGIPGRKNTQRTLDSLGLAHAGSVDQPFTIRKFGHLKVGFCAFAPNTGTMSIHNEDQIKEIISHLDTLTDIVVASFHAGAEGAKNQKVTRKREYYYGEDRGNVYDLAHKMIDMGADIILGHGPHIMRAIEVYNKKLIAYSLGNFLTYGRFNLRGVAGESVILEVKMTAQGDFITGKLHAFRQSYTRGPRIDLNLSSIKTIQRLSLEDFPESEVVIDDSGSITYN